MTLIRVLILLLALAAMVPAALFAAAAQIRGNEGMGVLKIPEDNDQSRPGSRSTTDDAPPARPAKKPTKSKPKK